MLEIYSNYLLGRAGRLVYAATSAILSIFAHIWGYVLMDLTQPITTQVEIEVLDHGSIRLDVSYKSLPCTCDFCKEKGHPERLCVAKC